MPLVHCRLGTIDYLSPEILDCPVKQHPQDHKVNPQKWYTCKVDVWSIGVLAYELLLGRTPFEAVSDGRYGCQCVLVAGSSVACDLHVDGRCALCPCSSGPLPA